MLRRTPFDSITIDHNLLIASPPEVEGYRIVSHLGEGGASHVWLAGREPDGMQVALKILKTTPAEDVDAFQRFRQEQALIASVRHANVVDLLGDGFAGAHPYIVLEYLPRGSLREAIAAGLSPRQALAVLAQLAGALAQMHAHHIIHRDLKPQNILIREDGTMAIADFGVATRIDSARPEADQKEVFGSPHYLAPELIGGSPASELTDLYSLGIVFHEMLTGRKPYVAASVRELAALHVNAPVPRLPEDLLDYQGLLAGLLAKDPRMRIGSAAELLDSIDDIWTRLANRVMQMR